MNTLFSGEIDGAWVERVLDLSWRESITEVQPPGSINDIYFYAGVRIIFIDMAQADKGLMTSHFYLKASGCCDKGVQTVQGKGYSKDWLADGFFQMEGFRNNAKCKWIKPTEKTKKVATLYNKKINHYMKFPQDLTIEKPWGPELVRALHKQSADKYEKNDTNAEKKDDK